MGNGRLQGRCGNTGKGKAALPQRSNIIKENLEHSSDTQQSIGKCTVLIDPRNQSPAFHTTASFPPFLPCPSPAPDDSPRWLILVSLMSLILWFFGHFLLCEESLLGNVCSLSSLPPKGLGLNRFRHWVPNFAYRKYLLLGYQIAPWGITGKPRTTWNKL